MKKIIFSSGIPMSIENLNLSISITKMGILLILISGSFQNGFAQVAKTSELFKTLQELDKRIFETGFNNCELDGMEQLIGDDLEFYHDQGGIARTKEVFLTTLKQNICSNWNQKPLRRLDPNSLKVFPLYDKGILYGAIQNGIHHFFIKEKNKEPSLTSIAKFSHLWLKEGKEWKLKRVFSFDHQKPKTTSGVKTEVKIPDTILNRYMGNYKGKNIQAVLTRTSAGLVMTAGKMELILVPESKTLFFVKKKPLTFEFILKKSKIQKMIVRENDAIVDQLFKTD